MILILFGGWSIRISHSGLLQGLGTFHDGSNSTIVQETRSVLADCILLGRIVEYFPLDVLFDLFKCL